MEKQSTLKTQKSIQKEIIAVRFAAIALSSLATDIQSIFGGLLNFGLVGAVWITGWLNTRSWKITNGKIVRSIIMGILAIGLRQEGYVKNNIPEPSYSIISEIPAEINDTKFELILGLTDTKKAKINGEAVEIINNEIRKIISLDDPETVVDVYLKKGEEERYGKVVLKREMSEEEKIVWETQKEEERIAQEEKQKEEDKLLEVKREKEKQERELVAMKEYPVRFIEVIDNDRTNAYGVASHSVKLKNSSNQDYKDITVMVHYYSASNTLLSTEYQVIYDVLPAGATKTFRDINMGFINSQASASRVSVTNAKLK